MTLRDPSQDTALARMETLEAEVLAPVIGDATRRFLGRVESAAVRGVREAPTPQSIVAAAPEPEEWPLTEAEAQGWWQTALVAAGVTAAIQEIWNAAYAVYSTGVATASSLDALVDYLSRVTDRLVNGLIPPIPSDAMDRVRLSVTRGAALGWSTSETAQDISAELGWDASATYWREQRARAQRELDALLDPLGPPGSPARESARSGGNALVAAWQGVMAEATRRIDEVETYWQVRATRIARTESTGAFNFGALSALADEGVTRKTWVATEDSRTRPTHVAADGQTVPLMQPFRVGTAVLQMPGDPSGPANETINCRCTVINADS